MTRQYPRWIFWLNAWARGEVERFPTVIADEQGRPARPYRATDTLLVMERLGAARGLGRPHVERGDRRRRAGGGTRRAAGALRAVKAFSDIRFSEAFLGPALS